MMEDGRIQIQAEPTMNLLTGYWLTRAILSKSSGLHQVVELLSVPVGKIRKYEEKD